MVVILRIIFVLLISAVWTNLFMGIEPAKASEAPQQSPASLDDSGGPEESDRGYGVNLPDPVPNPKEAPKPTPAAPSPCVGNKSAACRAGNYIANLTRAHLNLVQRMDKGSHWSQDCDPMEISQPSASANQWNSCPRQSTCQNKDDIQKMEMGNEARLATEKLRCFDRSEKQSAENKELSRKANQLKRNEKLPKCTLALDPRKVKSLVIHESLAPPTHGPRKMQATHLKDRTWSDCGYHYVIAKDPTDGKWKTYECRPTTQQGAHAGAGLNEDSLGVVIAGNYEGPRRKKALLKGGASEAPAPENGALEQLAALVTKVQKDFPSLERVVGHGTFKAEHIPCDHRGCPGPGCKHMVDSLNKKLQQIRKSAPIQTAEVSQ